MVSWTNVLSAEKLHKLNEIFIIVGKEKKLGDKTIESNLICTTTLENEDIENNNMNKNTTNSEESQLKMLENEESKQTESNVLLEEEKEKENEEGANVGEESEGSKKEESKEQRVCTRSSVEQETVVLSEQISLGSENAEELKQDDLSVEKSYTPPLPGPEEDAHDSDTLDEEVNDTTPTRTACTKPTMLFTPDDDESEDNKVYSSSELMSMINKDLEKNDAASNNDEEMKENETNMAEQVERESEMKIGELPSDVGKFVAVALSVFSFCCCFLLSFIEVSSYE